jgi:Fic/DOC family
MHEVVLSKNQVNALRLIDPFCIDNNSLTTVAKVAFPNHPDIRVRSCDDICKIGGFKEVMDTKQLSQALELIAINLSAKRSCSEVPLLNAICDYHYAFENIHPLVDGNGRVGRVVMAMQTSICFGIPEIQLLSEVYSLRSLYYDSMGVGLDESQRKLILFDLLRMIIGI